MLMFLQVGVFRSVDKCSYGLGMGKQEAEPLR